MSVLYHYLACTFSRQIRLALVEKGLVCELREEKPWERRQHFLMLNPAGETPTVQLENGQSIAGLHALTEWLEEQHPEPPLLGCSIEERAETRRLMNWFALKFNREVTENIVGEKLMRRITRQGSPHFESIRAGAHNIHYHLDYIGFLTERRRWLAGENISHADLAAASQISMIDYIGDVPWKNHAGAHDWYARIKSRPSFRPLLADRIPGIPPAKHYDNLDF